MKSYVLKRNEQPRYEFTLYVIDTDNSDRLAKTKRVLPMLVGSDGWSAGIHMTTVATTLLLDYFDGEKDCEIKSRLLARLLANKLTNLGRKKLDRSWSLTETELNDIIIDIMVNAKHSIDADAEQYIIEECIGQRRDVVREEARRETLPAKPRRRLTEADRREATERRIAFHFPRGEE